MLVYFHIDELARDAVVASALKKEFEAMGGTLIYGNRFMTNYLLRHFNVFDAIILSSLAHYMDIFTDPDTLPDNVFILQTEAIGQATGTLRRMYGKYFGDDAERCRPWHQSVTGFLLWGHAHKTPFKEFFPEYLNKIRVVGHPRLSDSCKKPVPALKKDKTVVGFVSRFNLLSPHDSRTPFESVLSSMKFGKKVFPLYENSPDKDVEDMFYTEVIDFRIMYQIIATLDPDKYDIHVRPHPRESRLGWMTLAEKMDLEITVSTWDQPFGHWLEGIDVVVTPPSTSLYDVFFHSKKPIVTSDMVPSRSQHILAESDDNNQILQATCRPRSIEEAIARIETNDVPFDKDAVEQRLYEQVGADVAANSIKNILAAIPELRPAATSNQINTRQRLVGAGFVLVSLALSHLRWLKNRLSGRIEQGSSFDMTWGRMRWVARLTQD